MSNLYENKIGPAGLPVGIGSKGNTVQLPEDGNPFDSLVLNDLNRSTYDRLNASIDDLDNRPGIYPESLNTVNNISTDEIASLSEEKRTVEERIAVLKEEIQLQRNLKDAEDSPLMEIALHRFKAYGDPSGLNDIANRKQTRDMAEENMKYSRDMAKIQKEEADAAAMKDKETTLSRLNIIAKNAKDTLDNAKRSKGENSDEYRSALANYNLARHDVITAANGLNDPEQLKVYNDAYPELANVKSNTSEGDSLVNIEDDYKALSLDKEKSAFDRAKELKEKGKPEGMSDKEWVTLKNELNAKLKEAYDEEVKIYNIDQYNKKSKELFEAYAAALDKDDLDEIASILNELKNRGFKTEDIAKRIGNKKYPTVNNFRQPVKPGYLK